MSSFGDIAGEFLPFPKIARLMRDIVITEKLDGTNAQILIDDSGTKMVVGSRNRIITPEDDNYGFARWCKDNEAELLKLGPGRHFGEWWGGGIQRRYGLDHKRFSLFNVGRWGTNWVNGVNPQMAGVVDRQNPNTEPVGCCYVVPVLYEGPFNMPLIDASLASLAEHGSTAAPGFMDPEGIVVYHKASGTLFKRTVKNDASPKGGPQ